MPANPERYKIPFVNSPNYIKFGRAAAELRPIEVAYINRSFSFRFGSVFGKSPIFGFGLVGFGFRVLVFYPGWVGPGPVNWICSPLVDRP